MSDDIKKPLTKESLENFLTSMASSIEGENLELYKRLIDGMKVHKFASPEKFSFAVQYPWDNFIDGFLQSEVGKDHNLRFIFAHSGFIEAHFAGLFKKHEGFACCSDKSRTIVNVLARFYTTGEKIEFDYDGKYTYHLPKILFKDHDSIVGFFEALQSLYYGNPDKYLVAMKGVVDTMKDVIDIS